MFSLICVWINCWVNNREAGDLRRYRAHYDVIVMSSQNVDTGDFNAMLLKGARKWEHIPNFPVKVANYYSIAQGTIRVAIQGVTMLRIWCFKKSHTKLFFTCFWYMLEWYEAVRTRIVALEKALFWEKVIYGIYAVFHRYGVSFRIHPVFYIWPCEELYIYHWMAPITAPKKLILTFSDLICSDTKRIDKMMCLKKMSTRYGKQKKTVTG